MRLCRSIRALTTTTLATEPPTLRQGQNFLANDWKKKRRLKGAFLTVLRYRQENVSRLFPFYCKQDIFIFYIQWLIFLLIGNTMKNTMLRKGLTIF